MLTIDLNALRANYRLLRSELRGVRCAAVVKADGYGLGAVPVANALSQEGCDMFFVAHLCEALALKSGLSLPAEILVLNGLAPGSEAECAAAGIIPVLNSRQQVDAWRAEAKRISRRLPAALQVDSGMARLGLPPDEVHGIAGDANALNGIEVRLVMSHLARADEPGMGSNTVQARAFAELAAKLPAAPRSLANSSGIFLGDASHFDLARPGAALYGINPVPGSTNPMQPVVRLQAKIVQTRRVPAGAGIGYGHAHVAPAEMALATIALGYADGWHRNAASAAWWRGVRLPFVGRVSMDSIIVDISALPAGALAGGDLVDLICPEQPIDTVAAQAGTIGYEILTSLGRRFHRIYKDEPAP